MDKLVIFNENLFCISSADGNFGPSFYVKTYDNPQFNISGKLSLLGLSISVNAHADKKGFSFEFKETFLSTITFDANARFGNGNFDLSGSASVIIGTINLEQLGKININTGIAGALKIHADSSSASASLAAGLVWKGNNYDIGIISLAVDTDSLKNLPETLGAVILDFFTKLFTDATEWAKAVACGLVKCDKDMLAILCDVFNKPENVAQDIINLAYDTLKVCPITTAVKKL